MQPPPLRRAELTLLIGVPVVWAILLLFHPTGEGEDFYPVVHDEVTVWMIVHLATLVFIPLFAATVYLLLRGVDGAPARVSRVALVGFVLFYGVWETLVGVGLGLLTHEVNGLASADQAAGAKVVEAFADGGVLAVLEFIGNAFLLLALTTASGRASTQRGRSPRGTCSPRDRGRADRVARATVRTVWAGPLRGCGGPVREGASRSAARCAGYQLAAPVPRAQQANRAAARGGELLARQADLPDLALAGGEQQAAAPARDHVPADPADLEAALALEAPAERLHPGADPELPDAEPLAVEAMKIALLA